jgi:LemA protein
MTTLAWMALLALGGWGVFLYNRLVADRHRVSAAWSDIGVQLKRRHDLLPKLVDAVRAYADYEQATLSAVVALRNQSSAIDAPADKARVEQALGSGVRRLLALAEQYPELKADRSFLDLQRQLSAVEDQIQYARRFYNGAVRLFNTRLDTFPDLLVARLRGYRPADYFELETDAAEPPELMP